MKKFELEKGVSAIEVTHHGRTVYGDAYIPDAEEFPLVIFSHGYNGHKDDFQYDARFLMDKGVASLTFTFCGSGSRDKSGFGTTNMTLCTEREELSALIDYAIGGDTELTLDGLGLDQLGVCGNGDHFGGSCRHSLARCACDDDVDRTLATGVLTVRLSEQDARDSLRRVDKRVLYGPRCELRP